MRRRGGPGLGPSALTRGLAVAALCAAAGWPSSSFGAEGTHPDAGRVLLGVATPELPGSVHRDFELNITRGLRFGGLDVVADSVASGTAPGPVITCADPTCFREIGTARGAGLVARAFVGSAAVGARESAKRTYSIKIQVFSSRTGQSLVERGASCDACATEVAAHLGYLVAMEVGQKLSDLRRPVAAGPAPPAPPAPAPRVAARAAAPTTVVAPARTVAVEAKASDDVTLTPGRSRTTKIGVGVLGGLGVAAAATGVVLWARGPQSACPDRPASACGQTYDDAPTGWLLTGVGAAAIAGAIVWWMLPRSRETAVRPAANVALVPGGLIVSGRF